MHAGVEATFEDGGFEVEHLDVDLAVHTAGDTVAGEAATHRDLPLDVERTSTDNVPTLLDKVDLLAELPTWVWRFVLRHLARLDVGNGRFTECVGVDGERRVVHALLIQHLKVGSCVILVPWLPEPGAMLLFPWLPHVRLLLVALVPWLPKLVVVLCLLLRTCRMGIHVFDVPARHIPALLIREGVVAMCIAGVVKEVFLLRAVRVHLVELKLVVSQGIHISVTLRKVFVADRGETVVGHKLFGELDAQVRCQHLPGRFADRVNHGMGKTLHERLDAVSVGAAEVTECAEKGEGVGDDAVVEFVGVEGLQLDLELADVFGDATVAEVLVGNGGMLGVTPQERPEKHRRRGLDLVRSRGRGSKRGDTLDDIPRRVFHLVVNEGHNRLHAKVVVHVGAFERVEQLLVRLSASHPTNSRQHLLHTDDIELLVSPAVPRVVDKVVDVLRLYETREPVRRHKVALVQQLSELPRLGIQRLVGIVPVCVLGHLLGVERGAERAADDPGAAEGRLDVRLDLRERRPFPAVSRNLLPTVSVDPVLVLEFGLTSRRSRHRGLMPWLLGCAKLAVVLLLDLPHPAVLVELHLALVLALEVHFLSVIDFSLLFCVSVGLL
mmetsp:Transcript_12044/g.25797  ORF Transcript_12044/g.25797 Transcript_12044/m.25797 type:complete len:609 (+) Transcript_12044:1278-3104(+)